MRTGAAALLRADRALRPGDVRGLGRADVRPRRGGRARLTSSSFPTAATSATGAWTTTASTTSRSPSRSCSRSTARRSGVDFTSAPDAQAGPINCPIAVDRLGEPDRDLDARRRRRVAQRGPLPPDRGRDPAGLDVPPARRPRRASSTAGRRCRRSRSSTTPSRKALPTAVAGLQRRRHLRAGLVGQSARRPASPGPTARRTRSARARSVTATAPAACIHIAESATRFSPVEVWETKNPWLLEKVELRRTRAAPAATAAASASTCSSRCSRTAT